MEPTRRKDDSEAVTLAWTGGSWRTRYHLPSLGDVDAWFTEAGIRRIDLPDGEDSPCRAPKADPNDGYERAHGTPEPSGFREPREFREPPDQIRRLAEELATLLMDYDRGEPVSFDHLPLDMTGLTPFQQRVYQETRRVGWGETTTYGELAERSNRSGGARAVGQAMGRNPYSLVVP